MITGMEHEAMISPETRAFVVVHRNEDVRELALKSKHVDGLDLPQALNQIAGWQIARNKLPEWADCDDIIYPPHISMEQCSSQFTAQYKAESSIVCCVLTTVPTMPEIRRIPTISAKRTSPA